MKGLRLCLLISILLAAVAAGAERKHTKNAKPRRHLPASSTAPTTLPSPTMATPQPESPVIPQQASFNANMKQQKKVVIVPAPPPPPGRDLVPPKQ